MTGADWIIVAAIVLSVVMAATQGFFCEMFSLAGVVVGYLVAVWQFYRVAAWFEPYVKAPWIADAIGFLIIFVAIGIVAGVLGKLVRRLMKAAGLSGFDRFLGALFGLLRGCLLVSVLLLAQAAFAPGAKWLETSELAPYFLVVGRAVIWLAPSELRGRFYQGLDLLRQQRSPVPAIVPGMGSSK